MARSIRAAPYKHWHLTTLFAWGFSKTSSDWCGARKASAAAKRMFELFETPQVKSGGNEYGL